MSESSYRMGWLLVIFDLPVTTKREQRLAQRFRKDLLDRGYLMLQFSVYARCAVTFDRKASLITELASINPRTGNIQCFFITDAQWGQSIVLHTEKRKGPYGVPVEQDTGQLQFW